MLAKLSSFWGSRVECFLALSQLLGVNCIPHFGAPPLSSKPAAWYLQLFFSFPSASLIICPSLILNLLPSFYKDLCDYIGPIWIIQDNLPHLEILNLIMPAKSFLTFTITYSPRFWGFGHGHLCAGGGHFAVHHE